jgi:hypothetical protein
LGCKRGNVVDARRRRRRDEEEEEEEFTKRSPKPVILTVLLYASGILRQLADLTHEFAPQGFQAATLEANIGGAALAGAGPGAARKRIKISQGFFFRARCRDGSDVVGLTEEISGASEDVGKKRALLVLAGGRFDGIGRDHGFLAAVAARPDAVVGEHGAVAAG